MNNDFLRQNDDGIGIDPTTLDVIESLDDPAAPVDATNKKGKKAKATKMPKEKKEKKINPDAKPGDSQKKLLLIVLIVALIGGVGYGVYWYLNLGTTNNAKKNNEKNYVLEDKYITIDDMLSDSILDYGEFPGVDLKECTLDTKEVNVSELGDYPYYVTCNGTKYSARIYVIEPPVFEISNNLSVTYIGGELDINSLYSSQESYVPSVIDGDILSESLNTSGFKKIEFYLTNELSQRGTVSGIVYVLPEEYDETLTCESDKQESNGREYYNSETVYFSNDGSKVGSLKEYVFTLSADDMDQVIKDIKDDGTITYNSITGYALVNKENFTLTIAKENTDSSIDGKTKDELQTYYSDTKKYTCK